MTTNTNPSRTAARFFASATPNAEGLFTITDRTDGLTVAAIKGRAAARTMAATLTAINPGPRAVEVEAKPLNLRDTKKAAKAAKKASTAKPAKAEPKPDASPAVRTSHADCGHASSKLARAICRRERAKADA